MTDIEKPLDPYSTEVGDPLDPAAAPAHDTAVTSEQQLAETGALHACPRARDLDERFTTPGSVKMHCSICGEEVWVAPPGQRLQAYGKNALICRVCLIATLQEPE